ncbi:MAG: radical SAM protein [Bacillota bacterium]|nr:radical SAM protein [Bacillota bacterium]
MDNQYVESRISRFLHMKASAAGIPLSGTFELTPCCNLSCKMCYVRKPRAEMEAEGGLISADKWIALAEKCREKGMLYLLLTGGEPLTHPEFKKIYTAVRNMGFVVSINSNGTLIDDEMAEFFAANPPARINMSLYGASRETYAELCGVPSAYDRAMHALKALRKAGVTVKLNYSVTKYNRGDMHGIINTAHENDCNIQVASYMFPPLRRDGTQVGTNDRMSPEEDAKFFLESESLRMSEEEFARRCKARVERCTGTVDEECMDAPTEHIRCRAGSTAFWVAWNGDISLCGMIPVKSANILETDFDEAWSKVREDTAKILMPAKCTACGDREVCMVCAASCYCETGHFGEAPEYICRRTKALIEESEKLCRTEEE